MIAYIDSSVLMRILLSAPDPLAEWRDLTGGVASELLRVECRRALDQYWHRKELTDIDLIDKLSRLVAFLSYLDLQPLDTRVLDLASEPLPSSLGTLDAIHLATAMIHRAGQPADERPILFATHDLQLARAARAMRFDVIGAAV